MKHASDISDTYLIIANQSLLRIFNLNFYCNGFLFTYIFFHSAPDEGLYCKPKYRAILLKIIWSIIPFYLILVTSAVGVSVPSLFCILPSPPPPPPTSSTQKLAAPSLASPSCKPHKFKIRSTISEPDCNADYAKRPTQRNLATLPEGFVFCLVRTSAFKRSILKKL